jgi:hypothetical protein
VSTPSAARDLGCVYLIDLSSRYVQMTLWSISSLRQRNADLPVVVLVVGHPGALGADGRARHERLVAAADEVRFVEPLHEESGYFLDNRSHIGAVALDPMLYLDADTIVFGDLRALAERFAGCDVAARPSDWAFRGAYRSSLAPDIICPMNSGAVLMTAEFANAWSVESQVRVASLMERPERSDLAAWLRRVTPTAWSKEEWAFSELAWDGPWSVGLFADTDCHLLAQQPEAEDTLQWRRSTIFHTYSSYWSSCVNRLLTR